MYVRKLIMNEGKRSYLCYLKSLKTGLLFGLKTEPESEREKS